MRSYITHYFILFLSFIFSLNSCSKLINDEYPEFEEIPTVNALLISGDTIKVHVSLSVTIDTTEIKYIDNADVIITSSQGELDTLELLSRGLYISDMIVKEGVEYRMEVQIEGFGKVFGSDKVPTSVSAKIFDHTNHYRYDEEGSFTEGIGIKFYDNPNTIDYYEIALINEDSYSSSASLVSPYNDNSAIILNEGFEPYSTPTLVFSDQLMEDTAISLYLDYYQGQHTSGYGKDSLVQIFDEHTMILEFRHISEEYYNYKKDFYFYKQNRYPGFVEGTATTYPVYTNIENGLGIIGTYSFTRDSIWIPEEHLTL
jgi:hypothetical protein